MVFEKIISSVSKTMACLVLLQYAVYLFITTIPKDKHYDEVMLSPNKLKTLWKKKARFGTLITEFSETSEFQKLWAEIKIMWAPVSEPVSPK